MQKIVFLMVIVLLALGTVGCSAQATCPLTVSGGTSSFTAPAPYSPAAPGSDLFWYGSEGLWTALPKNGIWSDLPLNPEGYTQKILWWSESFSVDSEPEPNLTVSGERLDEEAPPLKVSRATNAFAEDIGSAMLVGVDFPTAGCWKVTGQYKKAELTFVIQISP